MAATTGTGSRSIRLNSSSVCFTTSAILGSVSKPSNSRISAPAMKLRSLALISTRPFTSPCVGRLLDRHDDLAELLGRAAAERVHALALAVDDRPGDALEIDGEAPVLQIGKCRRHGRALLGGNMLRLGSAVPSRRCRRSAARELARGKIVDGDDARHEIAKLGKRARFGLAQHALRFAPRRSSPCRGSASPRPCGSPARASCRPPRRPPPWRACSRAVLRGRPDRRR